MNVHKDFADEAKKRWGGTDAWREFEEKAPGKEAADGLMALFAELGKLKELPTDDPRVSEAIGGLKRYISDNFYTCTDEILSGLGQMYSADPRFKASIDEAGGEGTAEFVSEATARYLEK